MTVTQGGVGEAFPVPCPITYLIPHSPEIATLFVRGQYKDSRKICGDRVPRRKFFFFQFIIFAKI